MKAPQIKVKPPGPQAREIVARDHRVTAPAYGRVYPLVTKRAKGMTVEDVDGNLYLDFMAGIAVVSTGHCHPAIVAAVEDQTRKFLHICGSDFYFEAMVALAEKLEWIAPGAGAKKVFLT
ncbi:MAG TPA: aminotransferase class III-fold pyridoxal phosphate-dependent enzyme, partial [Terriglobales bacterium]|nr:aminotransferase class III-fold pyridoxal phosphate-dependent enzyme [Terriglobales bacterium]